MSGTFSSKADSISSLIFSGNLIQLIIRYFEDQFIMDLHEHSGSQVFFLKKFLNMDHCKLYNIRCSSLNRHIDRRPLCEASPIPVAGMDVRNVTRSEEHTSELQSRGHLVCR